VIPTQFDSGRPRQRPHDRDLGSLPDGLERDLQIEDDADRIRQSWADRGEPARKDGPGDALWLAVRVRQGTERIVRVGPDGEPSGVADSDPVLEILYVRRDCERALSKTFHAVEVESGWLPDPSRYRSRIAEIRGAGWPLDERRQEAVVDDVLDLYGPAVLRESESETEGSA